MKATFLVVCAVVLCAPTIALPQSATRKPDDQKGGAPQASAELAFTRLKTLAGNWKGSAKMGMGPQAAAETAPVRVSLRVTSGGDALLHEMVPEGRATDPTNGADDPVTIFYLDGDRLLLTHYCDSGKNRPRMAGKLLADGKTVEFEFLDVSGGTAYGHMHHAVFTIIDADHHTEDWTYMSPANEPAQAHIELARAK
jgi:hypothetical protein